MCHDLAIVSMKAIATSILGKPLSYSQTVYTGLYLHKDRYTDHHHLRQHGEPLLVNQEEKDKQPDSKNQQRI